ncbi:MAG TPA: TonB-dependent receptor [Opitutaceae bacterium]|nr:TonB-dependent receptor [Opitutaceae bacterium]
MMTHSPATLVRAAGAALLLAALSAAAQTAPATTDDNSVVRLSEFAVTANQNHGYVASETMTGSRVNTKIVDLPYSVVNLTNEFFEDFGILELDDSLTYIGGFTGLNIGGGFNLRGFSSTSQLRDGFYRLGRYGESNVDRIEIIRGPNAAIYGRASPGGMVNMISKQPRETESERLSFSFGSYNQRREMLEATGPLPLLKSLGGKTYYIVTVSQFERRFDGEYAHTRNNELYGAVKHDFDNGAHLTLTAEYFLNIRHAPNSTAPMVSVARAPTPDNTATSMAVGYATNLAKYNAFGPNSELNRGSDTFTAVYDKRLTDVWSLRVGAQYFRARRWDYNQNTGWGSITINPANPTVLSTSRGATPNKGLIQEDGGGLQTDLAAHYKLDHGAIDAKTLVTVDLNDYYRWDPTWSYAAPTDPALVAWSKARTVALNQDFTPTGPVPYFPNWFQWGKESLSRLTRRRTTSLGGNLRQQAAFLQGRLLTFAGFRYDAVRFLGWDRLAKAFPSYGIPGTDNMVHRVEHQLKPNLGFNYRVGGGLHFYGSYSESYFVDQTANIGTIASPNFRPETAKGFDYGIKGSFFNERLNFTLGGYYINRYAVTVTDAVETPPGSGNYVTISRSDGDQLVRGWEADFNWRPTDELTFGGSFAEVNSLYTNFGTNFPEVVGRSVNGVSPENGSVYAKYDFTRHGLRGFSANLMATYVSSTPSESPNAGDTIGTVNGRRVVTASTYQWKLRTPSFTLWNAGIHYRFPQTFHGLEQELSLNVNNMFDRFYQRTGRTLGDSRTILVTYSLGHSGAW